VLYQLSYLAALPSSLDPKAADGQARLTIRNPP
jgi:hypothetical protein